MLIEAHPVSPWQANCDVVAAGNGDSALLEVSDGGCSVVFTGDVLFAGVIGRTDLPGGNMSPGPRPRHHAGCRMVQQQLHAR